MRKFYSKALSVILFSFLITTVYSQCLLRPVDLDNRIDQSTAIIEGRIISKISYWNSRHDLIYTAYKMEVYKIFKGNIAQTEVEIITEGGIVGNIMHRYEPNLEMNTGDIGILMLEPTFYEKNPASNIPAFSTYRAYALSQGFIKYNETEKTATDIFNKYEDLGKQLYNRITAKVRSEYISIKPYTIGENNLQNNRVAAAPVISTISPTTITAGTKSQLTINGNNFGSSMGTSTVLFKFADDGGASYYTTPSTEIISWSNTQIVLYVPTKAGTGQVQVTVPGAGGGTATSTETLIIPYANLNVSSGGLWFTRFVNDNASGGYTWNYFTGFDANTNAKNAFERAFQSWRCATSVNWQIGGTTSTNVQASDGVNVVRFDIGSELPAGVLGQCGSYWSGCTGNNWYVSELDIRFDDGTDWYYGTGNPGNTQTDFESVTLHELGHGHQLGHIITPGDVMYYALADGAISRTLSVNDINGGNTVMTRSTGSSVCSQTVMTSSAASNCSLGSGGDYRSIKNGSWSDNTVWEQYNGTAWIAAATAPNSGNGTITIRNTDTVSVDDYGIVADQVVVEVGSELILNADFTLDNGPGDDLKIDGNLTWNNSQLMPQSTNASILIDPGAVADFNTTYGSTLGCQFAIAAGGTLNINNGSLYFIYPGAIVNDGTINCSGNMDFSTADFGSLTNNGTINKNGSGDLSFSLPFAIANNGIINVNSGGVSTGYIENNSNSNINIATNTAFINTGLFYYNGGIIQGSGLFTNSDSLFLVASLTIPSGLDFNNTGVVDSSGNLTVNHAFKINGTIRGSGAFSVNGKTDFNGGFLGRSLTINAPDTIIISVGQLQDGAVLTVANGATLQTSTFLNTQFGGLNIIDNSSLINNGVMEIVNLWFLVSDSGGSFTNNNILNFISYDTLFFGGNNLMVTNSATGVIKGTGIMGNLIPANKYVNNGTISPGDSSISIISFVGANPLKASTKLIIELAGDQGGGQINGHDEILKQDTIGLVLAGTLNAFETGPVPPGSYTIIETHGGGKITGSFSTVNLPPGYTKTQTDTTVILNKTDNSATDPLINFRTIANGNWNDIAIWEMFSAGNWVPATLIPSYQYGTINIRNSHTVTVNSTGTQADQLTIESGGELSLMEGFTLNNGTGDDMTVAGKLSVKGIDLDSLNGNPSILVSAGGIISLEENNGNPSSVLASMSIAANGVMNWISGDLTWKGNTNLVNNGAINISGAGILKPENNRSPNITNGGTITKSGAGTTDNKVRLTNSGTVNVNNGIFSISERMNNQTGGTINIPTGSELQIIDSLVYNGGSIVGPGTLNNISSGTILLNSDLIIGANLPFIHKGTIDGNGALTINHDFIIEGKIAGSGSLTITGNNILMRGGPLERPYTVVAGQTFTCESGSASQSITVSPNATFIGQGTQLSFFGVNGRLNNNGTMNVVNNWSLGGHLYNTATVTHTGTGTFTVNGAITNTASGILKGVGTINLDVQPQFFSMAGTISPGSPGILTLNSVWTPFNVLTTLDIEMIGNGGPGSPTGHDQLERAGNLTLEGTLKVTELGSVPPGVYTIISLTSGTISGTFTTLNMPANYTVQYYAQTVTVTKAAGPCVPVVNIAANPGNNICAGTNVTFTATPVDGGTSPSYQWKINGSNVGTNSSTYSNSSWTNGDIVTCVMTSNAPCANPTTATSNSITMTVNPLITPSVSIAASPGTTVCAGTNVTFTATPTNGGSPSYQWKLNGNNVGSNSNTYSNSSLAQGDVITCVMTTTIGCPSSPTATSNTITLTVNPLVVPSVTIVAGPGNTICSGTNITFTASATNGGTAPSYQWKLNGVNVGPNSNSYNNASLANGDMITCVLTSNANCVSPSTATSNTITTAVTPTVTPSITITANPGNTICGGTSVTFTASINNGGTTPSYQWKLNGTNVGTNSNSYTNGSLNNNDLVTCVLTSNANCASPIAVTSNSITMTVSPIVTPSVSIAANPGNTICAGTNVTFTATPTNGGATPAYQWKLNGNNVGTNSNSYQNAALATGDIITCVLTSSANCITTSTATSNAITMTVSGVVVPSVSITANPGNSICSGTNVTFTATPTNGGATPAYQWKLNGNNVGTNSNTYQNTALATGDVITCVMTSSFACANPTTATSNAITMTVTSNVNPSISIAANPGNTICAGTNVTFTATPTNGGATPTYQWKLNGNNVGANSNTYSNAALANGDVVSCVLTSSITCVTSATATSNTNTMNVTANVTPSVSITANPGNSICAGTNVTFTATPTNGGATPAYQWKLNGNNVGANSNTYANAALANGDVVTCVLTSSITCVTSPTATSNTITVTVTTVVTPAVSIAANPGNSVCAGTNVTFTATPTNGGATPAYQWKLNGNNVGTNSNTYQNASLVNGDVVSCVLTSSLVCVSSATATSNSITITVSGVVTPVVTIAANPGNTVCAGTNVTFTATPTNGGATPAYQWKLNGNNAGTNSDTYQNAALATGDVVSCVMTSSLPCANPATATSNNITMTVNAVVTPTVTIAANPGNTICSGTNVTFTATSTNGGAIPAYQWKLNGNNVGTNSSSYQNSSLTNGDILSCVMTSSLVCVTQSTATSNAITMTVTPSVVPSVSIAANPGNTICAGSNVIFTATPINAGATPAYQWKLNGNNVGANSNTYQNASLSNGDIVSCQLSSSATCAIPATATSNSITMTVNTFVAPSVSIAANTGSTICNGTMVTFTATPTNGGSTPSYQWKLNGNNVGTNSITYQNAALASGDVVTCVMTSSLVCVTVSTATSNAITITVTASVTPAVSITANPGNSICAGTNVIFTATPTNGGATPSYQWKLNGNNVGSNSAVYSNAALVNGDAVSCVLTSSEACANPTTATSNAITMSVTANVTPSVSIAANPGNSICAGTNVTFTATPTNGGATPLYQWKLNGNNVGSNSNTYANASLTNGDVVTCVLTSSITCVTSSIATSNAITMNVTANVTPSVSIAANPVNSICAGTNIIFTATPTNGGATPLYQWKLNGNNVGTNSNSYSNAGLANGDVVSCVMTSSLTCITALTATSNSITMNVTANVTPSVSIAASPGNTICAGTNVTFTATPTNGGATPSYQWKLNGNNVGTNSDTYQNAALPNGAVVTCVMTSSITCVTSTTATSNAITMTVNALPAITTHPATQASFVGSSVTFTVVATGAGLTYQWRKNGTDIPLATGSSYTINNLALTDAGNFDVVVTGTCPPAVTSNVAVLTVSTVSITTQPQNQAACVGNNAIFNITAAGTGLTYQWQVSISGGPFTNITGAISASLTLNAVSATMNGNQYRCVVSGSLNSNAATLTVNPLPVVTLTLPFDTVYQTTTLQQLSGGSPTGGTYTGTGISGTSFLPAAFQTGNYIVTYRFTNASGCSATATDNFTVIPNVNLLNLFPNPAPQGQVTIIVSQELLGGTANVYNEQGQKVANWRIVGRFSSHQFKWAAGTYIFDCRNGSTRVIKKLVITR